MYRILNENSQASERRQLRKIPKYHKPCVVARCPNQVWTWDITRLRGPYAGKSYFLYCMLDLFSRYVVGWMVVHEESSELAQHFIGQALQVNGVSPKNLTIHSDRGSPMTAKEPVNLLASLGLNQSFSRPRVSNDNPFSEAHFKTLKYHRLFKSRYESLDDARQSLDIFFHWYNNDHMHTGLGLMTPKTVHQGNINQVAQIRLETMKKAFSMFPERFPQGVKVLLPPKQVGINYPSEPATDEKPLVNE